MACYFDRSTDDAEMLRFTVDQYDRVILFSSGFERAIELLRAKNTHITVVSTEGMIARELRNVGDRYIDLNDIRTHIEKFDN